MQRIHIICHPKSGAGCGQKVLNKVIDRLNDYHIPYFTYKTQNSQSVDLITKQVMARKRPDFQDDILIIGGDGTLHGAVESLVHLGLKYPVAYIPAGTGNDFGRLWLKDLNVTDILEQLIFNRSTVDVPIYRYHNHAGNCQGIVLNSIGFGVDAITNLNTQTMIKKMPIKLTKIIHNLGLSYILGLIGALGQIPRFDLTIDNGQELCKVQKVSIATIVNNPFFGAGIKIDNLAKITDKEMSLITYHHIDVKAALDLVPRVLIHQNQNQSPHVNRFTGLKFHLTSDNRVQAQVDGEPFIDDYIDISLEIDQYPFIGVLNLTK